jgi:crotonobetainyl-CoA:carnitine CoA-transferase CaiB-like acyl-CoA transferase
MAYALEGVMVLDLSRVLAGPFCGMMLGDMGADVLKIEEPEGGDESRTWPPFVAGEAAGYLSMNRNKRNMTLNLKTSAAQDIFKKLVARADVLVENFRTGTMEGFGLGYDILHAINPRLIYCAVSVFGRSGPYKDKAGLQRRDEHHRRPGWPAAALWRVISGSQYRHDGGLWRDECPVPSRTQRHRAKDRGVVV